MMKRILLPLFLIFLALQIEAVERVNNQKLKTVVLVETGLDTKGSTVFSPLNMTLALAVRNYTNYYLYKTSRDYEIYLLDSSLTYGKYMNQINLSDYQAILYLRPDGNLEKQTVTVRDSRRIRHFKKIEKFLDFSLEYKIFTIHKGQENITKEGRIHEKAKPQWFRNTSEDTFYQIDSLIKSTPEPFEYIIQRALLRVLEILPSSKPALDESHASIPTRLQADSSFILNHPDDWQKSFVDILHTASWSFRNSFDQALSVVSVQTTRVIPSNKPTLRHLHDILKKQNSVSRDTLEVTIFNYTDPIDHFFGNSYEEIGLADLGHSRIILNELPHPKKSYDFWDSYFNGLTLLHEIGHSFGAIHVSDMNSVMNHGNSWLASDMFDPFNRQIIRAALSGELKFDDPVKYVSFVSEKLNATTYSLVDYPKFFYRYLTYGKNKKIFKKLKSAISRSSYITAAEAFGYLKTGYLNDAARLFKKALEDDPHQASLYYYLALATTGEESEKAMNKAAEMGYYKAIIQLTGS